MTKKNPHIGSTFESWLDAQDIREEVTAAAIRRSRAVDWESPINPDAWHSS